MSGQAETVWDLDPHTRAKHVILRKYLNAWLPKLTRYNGRVVICDGFAGPGIYSKGEEGSPVIALNALLQHAYLPHMKANVSYLFVEADKKRSESLSAVLSGMQIPKSVTVQIHNEKCDVALKRLFDLLDEEKSSLAPTFAFIDPFGVQVPLNMVKRLMSHAKCEVLITFMISAFIRFISTPEFALPADQLFGCNEWRGALTLSGQDRAKFLRTLYQRQLETEVGAEYVRFFTMKDGKDKPIYDLFFATNHPSGIDAMKDAMWKVDQSGGYSFSDATDPQQVTLFTDTPNWNHLFDTLQANFGGTEQRWVVVEEYIRRTPFRILKRELQAESARQHSRFTILNSTGIRRGTLDSNTVIRFP